MNFAPFPLFSSRSQVPSDIEVSQSVTPLPISAIAEIAGIAEEELFPYGNDKAKASSICTLT
jgi:formyltetrahydrofolate synthetase